MKKLLAATKRTHTNIGHISSPPQDTPVQEVFS